jgi:hypothetical protein
MVLNYQYLMDGVFEPCLLNCKTDFGKSLLQEYMNCLGKAISEEDSSNARAVVMANSKYEKNLVKLLWQNHREALLEQFTNFNTDKNTSSKELSPFYIAIAETLCNLMNSSRISPDSKEKANEEEMELIRSMKKSKLGSRIFIYKDVEYKKGQRNDNNIGSLCRKLINAYAEASDKSFDDLEKKINAGGFKQNRWLCGVIIKKDDMNNLPNCSAPAGYNPERKAAECNQNCPNRPRDACCCIELFEDHFFKDFEIETGKDKVKFYVAKYFTIENLERLIDDLGFTNEVKIR